MDNHVTPIYLFCHTIQTELSQTSGLLVHTSNLKCHEKIAFLSRLDSNTVTHILQSGPQNNPIQSGTCDITVLNRYYSGPFHLPLWSYTNSNSVPSSSITCHNFIDLLFHCSKPHDSWRFWILETCSMQEKCPSSFFMCRRFCWNLMSPVKAIIG